MAARLSCCLLAMGLALATGCRSDTDDERLLRETIEAMEHAAEEGKRRVFMRSVADDFRGEGYDREGLANMVRMQLLRNQAVSANTINVDITLFDQRRASAGIRVLLTGGSGWLPERGQLYDIETGWRLTDEDWQLISASWSAVGQ